MGNISKEERQRREAAAAAQQSASETPLGKQEGVHVDPNVDVDIIPPSTYRIPEQQPNPPERPEKNVYDVDDLDVKHFKSHKLAEEKQKSLDAIEQAVRDACKIAENKIRKDPVVVALAEDPGDVGKRQEFLRKFGPSNVVPPKPEPTPYGIKDPALMEWTARYHPDEFVKTYGAGKSEIVTRLMRQIRNAA